MVFSQAFGRLVNLFLKGGQGSPDMTFFLCLYEIGFKFDKHDLALLHSGLELRSRRLVL